MNYRGASLSRSTTASNSSTEITQKSSKSTKPGSALVRAQQGLTDVSGINRYKYFYLPLSARNNGSNLDLKSPINKNIDKNSGLPTVNAKVEGTNSVASSGYDSLMSSSASNGVEKSKSINSVSSYNRKCKRCWQQGSPEVNLVKNGDSPRNAIHKRSGSLPNIETRKRSSASSLRQIQLHSKTPPSSESSKSPSPPDKEKENKSLPPFKRNVRMGRSFGSSTTLLDKEKQDELRERISRRNQELRRQLDEKLDVMKHKHQRAMKAIEEKHRTRPNYSRSPLRKNQNLRNNCRCDAIKRDASTATIAEESERAISKEMSAISSLVQAEPEDFQTQTGAGQADTGAETFEKQTELGHFQSQTEPETFEKQTELGHFQSQTEPEDFQTQTELGHFQTQTDPEDLQTQIQVGHFQTQTEPEDFQTQTGPEERFSQKMAIDTLEPELLKNELKSLIDAALRESVENLSKTKANEILATQILRHSKALGEVEEFVSASLIPEAVIMAVQDLKNNDITSSKPKVKFLP